jgi:hypothetical protein
MVSSSNLLVGRCLHMVDSRHRYRRQDQGSILLRGGQVKGFFLGVKGGLEC